ncbi:hypothetical protein L1987_65000 [Smallanthus sonchifolius]|uniref:Uncharacterized protein n=1 Tax=Smallanthus sonchifolius TaxID=185202 RepID=A0ACB9BTB4_9ASTR|nr:hypothetical protein L1987_65000 [Smallanthus sonchifolius]
MKLIGPITSMSGFPPPAPPPHHFGSNYWTSIHSTCNPKESEAEVDDDGVLLRTTSERITTSTSKEFDVSVLDEVSHCYSSLGLGRVATTDEDKWYEFDEEINVRIDWYISKSRRQAIGRRGIGGYY